MSSNKVKKELTEEERQKIKERTKRYNDKRKEDLKQYYQENKEHIKENSVINIRKYRETYKLFKEMLETNAIIKENLSEKYREKINELVI